MFRTGDPNDSRTATDPKLLTRTPHSKLDQLPNFRAHGSSGFWPHPKAQRTHDIRPLGPKTILYKAFGLFCRLRVRGLAVDWEPGPQK